MAGKLIILDSTPLWTITHPGGGKETRECNLWAHELLQRGAALGVPAIIAYEARRDVLRRQASKQLANIDGLIATNIYLPLTDRALRRAAELWADVRRRGRPTAHPEALDVDVILGAQAEEQVGLGREVVVATSNVGHLSLFCDARPWREIA